MLHNLYVHIDFCKKSNSLTDEEFLVMFDSLVNNEIHKSQIADLLENKDINLKTNYKLFGDKNG